MFLSPSLNHWILDLCLHIMASLYSWEFISFSNCFIRCTLPSFKADCSALAKSFCFFSRSHQTFLKNFLLHLVSSFPHLLIFLISLTSSASLFPAFHTASIVAVHPSSIIHIYSKRNGLCCLHSMASGTIHSAL